MRLLCVEGDTEAVEVPLINGWLQITLELRRVPSETEQAEFFADLQRMIGGLERRGLLAEWFFLHKAPGLRIRFRSAGRPKAMLARLLDWIEGLRAPWLGGLDFDSFLEQRELLMSGGFSNECARILRISSECAISARIRSAKCDPERWADFTIAFFENYLGDGWWVWEALGRMETFRSVRPPQMLEPSCTTFFDPFPVLERISARHVRPSFRASTALMVSLNYIYNQWSLDLPAQANVLQIAREKTWPAIAQR